MTAVTAGKPPPLVTRYNTPECLIFQQFAAIFNCWYSRVCQTTSLTGYSIICSTSPCPVILGYYKSVPSPGRSVKYVPLGRCFVDIPSTWHVCVVIYPLLLVVAQHCVVLLKAGHYGLALMFLVYLPERRMPRLLSSRRLPVRSVGSLLSRLLFLFQEIGS